MTPSTSLTLRNAPSSVRGVLNPQRAASVTPRNGWSARPPRVRPVKETIQPTPGDFLVVVELEAARSRVPRVDEGIAAGGHHALVERFGMR